MKRLVVESGALRSNLRAIQKAAGAAKVIAVLKGDAYGLGLLEVAKLCRLEGVDFFAVTEPDDVVKLREAGFAQEKILVLRSSAIRDELLTIARANGIATIGSNEAAVCANSVAEELGIRLECHVALDTGMGRYGFQQNETDNVISVYKYMKNLRVTGMYTHLNAAFKRGKRAAERVSAQLAQLDAAADAVKAAGCDCGMLHAANSPALFRYPDSRLDAVRVGSAYTGRVIGGKGLKRVGHAECEVIETRWLAEGSTVGYGNDYKTKKTRRIAVIPLGHSDGYMIGHARDVYTFGKALRYCLQELKIWAMRRRPRLEINGKKYRVLGHVGMLHTVVDITKGDVKTGDVAVFELDPTIAGQLLPKKYV